MMNFQYYTPTKVLFGKDTETQVGQLIKAQGGKKVLIHFGGGSVKRSGLLDSICASLDSQGIAYVLLGGVVPNPRLSLVYEGIELCRKEGVDFLLAVGGGSVIDSAKAIGFGLANDCDVWDLFTGKSKITGSTPVGAVLTIAAAGSEMSNSAVITNEDGWLKRGAGSDYGRCVFAVMNPELTYTLPEYQTASGCVDIIMHTLERYFTPESPTMELTDQLAEGLLRTVMVNAKILLNDPQNYAARAEIMWAGSLSHNGLTGCGGGMGDWSTHQMEHELGGMFDVAHGAGLSAIWGSWARYVMSTDCSRFARLAANVLEVKESSPEKAALAGIEALEHYFSSLKMPINIRELGVQVTDAQIVELAEKCSFGGTRVIGGLQVLDKADMQAIYTMAR